MATGYQKVSIYEDGETVSASLFNSDFNALTNAFNASTGHDHDGTTGGGAPISKIGDADFNNKIEIDGTNNLIKLFIEVGGNTATEILNVSESALVPVAASIDLGTVANPFDTGNITTLTSTSLNSTNLTVDTDTLYVDSANDRVGINTTAPDESLHLVDGALKISNASTTSQIIFDDNFSSSISHYTPSIISSNGGTLSFYKRTYPNVTQLFKMSTSGAIVGTTAVGAGGRLVVVTEDNRSYLNTNMLQTGNSTDSEGNVITGENSLLINNIGDTGDTIIKSLMGFGSNIDVNTGHDERAAMGAVYSNDNITDTALVFGTKTTGDNNVVERIRIDSTGKLGINTATPKSLLDIVSDGESIITLSSNDTSASQNELIGGIHFYNRDSYSTGPNNAVKITAVTSTANGEDGDLIFSTKPGASQGDDALESARIDSSGNLLVGKTATTFGTAGSVSYATGLLTATVDGNACVQLNRLTSDGAIQTFGKDGTTVGNIGTIGGEIYIESGDVGLQFDASGNDIVPYGGGFKDATIDLGSSNNRFKDIHLSGEGNFGTSVSIGTSNNDNTLTVGSFSDTTYSDDITVAIKCDNNDRGIILQQPNSGKSWSFGVGSSGEFKFYARNDASPAVTFLDSTSATGGNVGIGTSSPETLLHLESSDATLTATIESTNAAGVPTLKLKGSEASEINYVDENDILQTTLKLEDSGAFKVLKSDDTENFAVSTTGQISAKSVSLNNSSMFFDSASSNGHSRIFFNADTNPETGSLQAQSGFYFAESTSNYADAASIVYTADDEHIRFANKGGSQVMSIKESKVGILTANPAEALHVAGTIQSEKLVGRSVNSLFVIENKDNNGDVVNGIKLNSDGNFKIREGSSDSAYIIESTDDNFNIQRDNVIINSSGHPALTLNTGANNYASIYFDLRGLEETGEAANITYYGVNDKFVINDGSANTLNITGGKVGVIQQTPTEALDVTGNIKATGTLELGAITLPNTDGTSGQALVTDGSGAVSFGTVGTPTDVVVDGDFSSAGLMQTDGAGTYSVQAINGTNGQVLSTDGSGGLSWADAGASDAITDGDFTSSGVMTTDGSGTYSSVSSATEGDYLTIQADGSIQFNPLVELFSDINIRDFNLTTSDIQGNGRTRLGVANASEPTYSFSSDTDTGMYLSGLNTLSFATGGTERATITQGAIQCPTGAYNAPGVSFIGSTTTGMFVPGSNYLSFSTNGSTRMTITSGGYVGIGTGYMPQRLTVNGGVQASIFKATNAGSTISNAGFYNDPGLNIKSASSGSTYQLMINFQDSGSTDRGSIQTNNTSTQYNTTSDQRLKENIQDATDAGSKIDAIQIRQFDWIGSDVHQDYGVVAQELIDVAPEAVSTSDNEEDMMGVDYSKLVPMLIKEVQSLRSRVAELENN